MCPTDRLPSKSPAGVLFEAAQFQPPLAPAVSLAEPGPRACSRLWTALLESLVFVDGAVSGCGWGAASGQDAVSAPRTPRSSCRVLSPNRLLSPPSLAGGRQGGQARGGAGGGAAGPPQALAAVRGGKLGAQVRMQGGLTARGTGSSACRARLPSLRWQPLPPAAPANACACACHTPRPAAASPRLLARPTPPLLRRLASPARGCCRHACWRTGPHTAT